MSFIMEAPASIASLATSALYVSMLIGMSRCWDRSSIIGIVLRISSFAVDRHEEIQIVSLDGGIYKLRAELLP